MADIFFKCWWCGKNLVVDEAGAGIELKCPKCHTSVVVPFKQDAQPTVEMKCSSCGKAISKDDVICINCGLNLKTGTKVQSSVAQLLPGVLPSEDSAHMRQ